MGEQRIQEVNMVALLFLLLGVLFLLAAAGCIWIDRAPEGSRTLDSAGTNNPDEPFSSSKLSGEGDPVA